MDIAKIQSLAFTLVAQLTKFDPAAIVREKAEEFALVEELGVLITDMGAHGRKSVADGIVSGEELAGFKARFVALRDKAKELGLEVADQTLEE